MKNEIIKDSIESIILNNLVNAGSNLLGVNDAAEETAKYFKEQMLAILKIVNDEYWSERYWHDGEYFRFANKKFATREELLDYILESINAPEGK